VARSLPIDTGSTRPEKNARANALAYFKLFLVTKKRTGCILTNSLKYVFTEVLVLKDSKILFLA
jgi:hypothetical protein